jgi:toxin CcdB
MQCDIHENRDTATGSVPYLLDVQSDLLSHLHTRVVVPLIPAAQFGRRANRLHPAFIIGGAEFVLAPHLIAAIHISGLGKVVGSLADKRDVVIAAIDVLWSGV